MTLTTKGHWHGDARVACGTLTLTATTQADARKLAQLARVLGDPDQRARLIELAERVEAESAPALEVVGC